MRLYIVRHGETDWNIEHKNHKDEEFQKNRNSAPVTDDDFISINEIGIEQAEKIAEELKNEKIDVVITSPLPRTIQTAEIITKDRNIPIIIDDSITVRKFGEFKGKKADIDFDFTNGFWSYKANLKYIEAENIRDFFQRIYEFLDKLKENYEYKDKSILIVTHGSITIPIYCYFNGIPENDNLLEHVLDNCKVAIYEI